MFGSSQNFARSGLSVIDSYAPSQATQEAKRPRQEEKQSCLPVTIRAIETALSTAEGDDLRFYGTQPHQLVVVGCVEEMEKQSTSVQLKLNDGTGKIIVRHYLSGDDQSEKALEDVQPGRYVAAVGNVRTAPSHHLALICLRTVASPDEISYHFIEAAHAALRLQRGIPVEKAAMTPPSKPMDVTMAQAGNSSAVESFTTPPKMPALPVSEPALESSLRTAVLNALVRTGAELAEGVKYDVLAQAIGTSVSKEAVLTTAKELVEEGLAFETIDDEHFQAL